MYYNMYYAFNTCITNVINTKKKNSVSSFHAKTVIQLPPFVNSSFC